MVLLKENNAIVFVDTSALVSQINKRDSLHSRTTTKYQNLLLKGTKLITTMYIIDETVTELTGMIPHKNLIGFIDDIFASNIFKVMHVTEDQEKEAWLFYKEREDKLWSFTDCVSFIIMKELGITHALTSDHHFAQAGFIKLL